ncbi:unnamed protein product [Pedinophyceae sp. YPF-701]|nr:unnamed protein product [Pedinophyceae sp. YPF-701]
MSALGAAAPRTCLRLPGPVARRAAPASTRPFLRGCLPVLPPRNAKKHVAPPRARGVRTYAMVNVDLGPATVLGASLVGLGVVLYQVRLGRPAISRDYDVVFSSMSVLVGGILIFQGWRLDPLLMFGELLTAGVAVAFAVEALSLRSELTEALQEQQQSQDALPQGGEFDQNVFRPDAQYDAQYDEYGAWREQSASSRLPPGEPAPSYDDYFGDSRSARNGGGGAGRWDGGGGFGAGGGGGGGAPVRGDDPYGGSGGGQALPEGRGAGRPWRSSAPAPAPRVADYEDAGDWE